MTTIAGLLPFLLLGQAIVGGADTLLNHELIARLPDRPEARSEIALHAVREAIYATLFIGLSLFAWHGAWAWALPALLAAEVLVTGSDEYVENRHRLLPQNERVMHVLLTLNLGAIIVVACMLAPQWAAQPTALARLDMGWPQWTLVALGIASAAWSIRDALAWRRLGAQ